MKNLKHSFKLLTLMFLLTNSLLKSQNLIFNGSLENTNSSFNCALDILPNSNFINASNNVSGWTSSPPCNSVQNTPNVQKNNCGFTNTPFGSNFLVITQSKTLGGALISDEKVRSRFSYLSQGQYHFSLNVNFDQGNLDFSTPCTLLMSLSSGTCSNNRQINSISLAAVSGWTRFDFCFDIASNESFNEIEYRLINLPQGSLGSHVMIDEVSLEKISTTNVNEFSTQFDVQTNPWWGNDKTLNISLNAINSSATFDYAWRHKISTNNGSTWNLQDTWYWSGESFFVFGGVNQWHEITRIATVKGCPNIQACSAVTTVYADYLINAQAFSNTSATPAHQAFKMTYTRNGSSKNIVATPEITSGNTDEWRQSSIIWGESILTNPEWTNFNNVLPYSSPIQNSSYYTPFFTLSHRLSKAQTPSSFSDKITYQESYISNCNGYYGLQSNQSNSLNVLKNNELSKTQKQTIIENINEGFELKISPNPAQSVVSFESEVYNPMQSIELFDLSGRSINYVKNINSSFYQLNRGSIPNGMYIAKVKFEGGILSKKIVFDGK